ncbi:MAG: hypothetical protein LR008_01380 [Candidatus Pacebacteria bacterium]|nr:hypothetical protein [Candidatus Paceibacterota bacterium]
MAKESSLQEDVGQFVFDLDSQNGVMRLLASVRASEITTEQKNELRDLVFLYVNGGKDESVRITLEQKITAYAIKLSATPEVETDATAAPHPVFGTSRPAPSFSPTADSIAAVAEIDKSTPEQISVTEAAAVKIVEPELEPVPEIQPVSEPEIVAPPPPSVSMPAPESVVAPTPDVVPVPEPAVAPESVTPPVAEVVTASPSPEVSHDSAQNLKRIKEIKSIVNDKIGNPVNLVDINNEVGREYMGALLDAMKKLNTGTSTLSAMKRLEDSFLQVQNTIEEHSKNQSPAPIAENKVVEQAEVSKPKIKVEIPVKQEPVAEPMPIPAAPEPVIEAPVKQEPTVEVPSPAAAVPEVIVETPVVPDPEPEAVVETPLEPVHVPELKTQAVETPVPAPAPNNLPVAEPVAAPIIEKTEPAPEAETEVESSWCAATDTPDSVEASDDKDRQVKVASLAEAEIKLNTLDKLPTASSLDTSTVEGDPLFTKEVDSGLNQLLMEWSLFKKSGLFSTGPKGSEHPLYKKISELQIPLLLAGRFEGATQEIKQSITDYMNGWRYEQGIIYVQGENFDHYLRRVIRHILDLQKKK